MMAVIVVMLMGVVMSMALALVNEKLGGVNAVLEDLFGGDGVTLDTERLQAFLDGIEVGTRIDEGAHGHVAADAAEAVKVAGFHWNLPGDVGLVGYW